MRDLLRRRQPKREKASRAYDVQESVVAVDWSPGDVVMTPATGEVMRISSIRPDGFSVVDRYGRESHGTYPWARRTLSRPERLARWLRAFPVEALLVRAAWLAVGVWVGIAWMTAGPPPVPQDVLADWWAKPERGARVRFPADHPLVLLKDLHL